MVRATVPAMYDQVGDLMVDEQGLALSGVLVRHLVMPGLVEDAAAVASFCADLSRDCYFNLMDQYYPAWKVATTDRYQAIKRRVRPAEFDQARRAAEAAGLWRFDTRWRTVVGLH